MLSKKVMLAKAAEARRNTSPQEALSHNSERVRHHSKVNRVVSTQHYDT